MTEFFVKLLSMSLAASCLILVVLLLRLLLKGAPKWIPLLLWALVALRLICPISMESRLSLLPRVVGDPRIIESWRNDYAGDVRILHEEHPDYDKAVEAGGEVYTAGEGQFYTVASEKGAPNTIGDRLFPVLTRIWLLGAAGMLLYAAVSALRLRRRVSQAVLLRDNIFRSERVDSPFVLGLLCPRILLPLHLEGDAMELVIAHEKSHIRWGDPWWKLLGFLLLALYWFNPLVWLAYALLCRDMELACDERVIRGLDAAQRADYSEALLACSVRPGRIVACPLSFGEISVRQRIQNVLHYKKPTLWILLLALLLCAGAAVCFLTSPVAERNHIRLTETPSANDQGLRYGVKLDAPSLGCKLIAEQWKDGVCIDASPLWVHSDCASLYIRMNQRQINGAVVGTDIQLEVDSGSVLSYFPLAEGKALGWSFSGWEMDRKLSVEAGTELILAALIYDTGSGVRVFDCETLTREPERIASASEMIVVRAIFAEDFAPAQGEAPVSAQWEKPRLTLEDVLRLSEKGEALSWSDFEGYASTDVGFGLYILHYAIDGDYSLLIGGVPETTPMYIRLIYGPVSDSKRYIDIRREDVTAFLREPSIAEAPYRGYIDSIAADIDGDGSIEDCVLRYGTTSGLFTVVLTGRADGEVKYSGTYSIEFGEVSLVLEDALYLQVILPEGEALRYRFVPEDEAQSYSFTPEDNLLILTGPERS